MDKQLDPRLTQRVTPVTVNSETEGSPTLVWDTNTLTWVKMTQPTGGASANVAKATAADPVFGEGTDQELSVDLSGHLRIQSSGGGMTDAQFNAHLPLQVGINTGANTIGKVDQGAGGASAWKVDGSAVTQPVSGTFWQATQPVSGTFFQATQPVSAVDGQPVNIGTTTQTKATDGSVTSWSVIQLLKGIFDKLLGSIAVTGTFWQATQPVSGTITANAGTNLNTSALALSATQTDGTQKAVIRGGAKGATVAADVTGTAEGADHQAVDVQVYHGGTAKDPTAIRALTSADVVTAAQATAANLLATVTQGPGAAAGTSWRQKGDQARASVTVADPVIIGGRAATYPTKPTAVAAGQVVDFVTDLEGVQLIRPRQIATYVAIFRLALAAASSKLAFTFTANTDKQLATIYHAVGATKRVTIRRVWVQIVSTGAVAGEVQLELRTLSATTAPATGNPAITAGKRDQAQGAAEATTLALPSTAGSEVAANSPIASTIVNLVASVNTAVGTGWVPQDPSWIKLYDEASADDEEVAPVIRASTAEGYAVVGRSTAAVPLNFIVRMVFTEE